MKSMKRPVATNSKVLCRSCRLSNAMHPLEKKDFLCYPSKQVSKALLGKKHTSDVCLTTNKNVKMFLSHPKSQIMWFHSFRVNWPHLEQPQLGFLPLHWEMLRVFHKGDPVPAGQSISGHIPKAVFTYPFVALKPDLPVLWTGQWIHSPAYFIYLHASRVSGRGCLCSLPLLQVGFIWEDKRTSYRYFRSSE